MHREYHPDDMQHLRAHAFEAAGALDDHDHHHRAEHRRLYAITAVLGALIGLDLLLRYSAPSWRTPFGVSPIWVAALIGSARIVYQALEAMVKGSVGADVALAVAALAALALREPFVAAEVVFIALVGEVLEAVTADRALRSIRRLFDQAPRVARVRRGGQLVEVPPHEVQRGEVVVVSAGERIPVDGAIVSGRTSIDQSALTGESIPVDRGPGERVFTGTINQFGQIEVRADRVGHESTFGQVLKLVADAQRRKAPLHRTADRLARSFLPVVFAAAGLTVAAGLLLGWPDTGQRAVAVLVVACPCALILATPAAVMASMAWLARHGIVIKGGAALERLSRCDTIAFDKTGTLTLGRPELTTIEAVDGRPAEEVLTLAAAAERGGRHPLAEAVVTAAEARGLTIPEVEEAAALPGAGVEARLAGDGRSVLVGNRRLMIERGVPIDEEVDALLARLDASGETPLLVAEEGRVVGMLGARDSVRREAHDVVHDLKHLGFSAVALLTGDRRPAAEAVAKLVHIKAVEAELLPADKASWIRERQAEGRRVAMVGDGINDAPALAAADVGIALAGPGADLAAEAGDVLLMGEPLAALPDFVKLSRATVRVIRQNILVFAFGLNATAIALAMLGVLGPVAAAILHQAGSLLVLLNAMRLLAFGDWHEGPPFRQIRAAARAIDAWDDRIDLGAAIDRAWTHRRAWIAAASAVGVISYAGSGLTAVGPEEVGLVRRLGRFEAALGPGLHLRWPRPIERVDLLEPDRVRGVTVGYRPVGERSPSAGFRWESGHDRLDAISGEEALLMTGDGRLVELMATVQYRLGRSIDDLKAFAFGVEEAEPALRSLAEASLREVVGRRPLDELLTASRGEAERATTDALRRRADAIGLGVEIIRVFFRDAHPPLPVVDAYRDVSRAGRDAEALANAARSDRAERLAEARGTAAATLAAASADRRAAVALASARAEAFLALHSARSSSPGITDHRLFADAVEAAVVDRPKIILDRPRTGQRRHLILSDAASPLPDWPLADPPPARISGPGSPSTDPPAVPNP
ncbi:cation-translocating P-type ATPase family protein [Tautonia sociabilis]|uniref:P-type Zn(2+) transporter n=1 Tax=Tautonia sociabilis TaxID=2080755 RepID=A0A432MK77_9BACT|nr:cation-translocating P-type ATPase family protein [Tautonia sociabilis]RUL87607.1 cation-translocating P-type ATPase family protein [Tautonia sociabilis]